MPTVSLRSVVLSLTLHGVLLGAATRDPETLIRKSRAGLVAPPEAAITVDVSGTSGGSPLPEPSAAPAGLERGPVESLPQPSTPAPAPALRPRRTAPPRPALAPPAPAPAPPPEPTPPEPPAPEPPRQEPTPPASVAAAREAPAAPPFTAPGQPLAGAAALAPGTPSPGGTTPSGGPVLARTGGGTTGVGSGGGGVPGRSAGDGRAQMLASYLKGVRERVSRHREYPYLARRAQLEGTVCLRVVIAASGRVLGATPTCGGSQALLVEAALASVSSAAPFPPLPEALGQRLSIDVPVVFELDQN